MKLRKYIIHKNLTISEYASIIGYDRTYVQNWMSGRKVPSLRVMSIIKAESGSKVRKFEDLIDD